jgi:hypothetical protein
MRLKQLATPHSRRRGARCQRASLRPMWPSISRRMINLLPLSRVLLSELPPLVVPGGSAPQPSDLPTSGGFSLRDSRLAGTYCGIGNENFRTCSGGRPRACAATPALQNHGGRARSYMLGQISAPTQRQRRASTLSTNGPEHERHSVGAMLGGKPAPAPEA